MREDCQICLSQAAKYTCPKCRVKTCSLPCVQSHKKLQSCDGKRDKAGYIAKKKYDMACLTSDYCFLEDVSRAADNATRDNANSPSLVHANTLHKPARPLSYMQHLLTKECRSRGTTVKFMSAGMKRHDANQSMYRKKVDVCYGRICSTDSRFRCKSGRNLYSQGCFGKTAGRPTREYNTTSQSKKVLQ
ncbi:Box C/D snoRNA accumulation, variant 2 [Batrachochytrium dendrobatidis]